MKERDEIETREKEQWSTATRCDIKLAEKKRARVTFL
jgi:hypothetical protein